MVLNIHWTNKIKNEILYDELERLSNKIRRRRLKKRKRGSVGYGSVAANPWN